MTTAADLLIVKLAAADYRAMSERLEEEARTRDFRAMPLTVRIIRQWAFIARNAARAEEQDPDVGYIFPELPQ